MVSRLSLDLTTADSPYFHPHSLWSVSSGASWVSSISNGRCFLGAELNASVSSGIIPGACRSRPNSANVSSTTKLQNQAAFFRCCFAW